MSGETLTLAASADSTTAQLVRTLRRLPDEGLDAFCVIGGLAVLCRVGSLYRATSDLDTVVDDGAAIAALRGRPATETTVNGVSIDGTTIDMIEVGTIDDPSQLPDDLSDRLFVIAHRYAYDSAQRVAVVVVEPTDASTTIEHAEVAMATPAALVAMKLHSYPRRHGATIAKQGSDLQDLFALLERHNTDGVIGADLASAPHGLGALGIQVAQALLVDDAEVAAGRVRRYTSGEIDAEDVRLAGEHLIRTIEDARSSG